MREIWTMQPRFEKRVGSAPYSLLEQPRFRAGFDFLRLRGKTGEIDPDLGEWWEKFSTGYDDERHAMIEEVRLTQLQKPQHPRVRVKRADADAGAAPVHPPPHSSAGSRTAPELAEPTSEQGDLPPAKKRRRRRKPADQIDGGAAQGDERAADQPAPHNDSAASRS
jgi:poly(A) polymerase